MTPKSRLHVPKAHARPGETPDFSYVQTSPAGAVARPDINAPAADIADLANSMVRVLDDDHRAVGPWHPHLEAGELQIGLRHMLLTRLYDWLNQVPGALVKPKNPLEYLQKLHFHRNVLGPGSYGLD